MATSLTTDLTLKLGALLTNPLDLSTTRDPVNQDWSDALAEGTGSDQADVLWHDTRTLAGTSEDLDLAASLTDAFGTSVTFVNVKLIAIRNNSTTTTESLAIGGAAATQFINWVGDATDIVNLGPSGIFLLWDPIDGYPVTAGTGDLLKIDSGADTFSYDIIIVGTSA